MAKPHWSHSYVEGPNDTQIPVWGCQHSECTQRATRQWQRTATPQQIEAELCTEGPYGSVVRNVQGPHRVAVFSCEEHALPADSMIHTHDAACSAPDPGCVCDADDHAYAAARG